MLDPETGSNVSAKKSGSGKPIRLGHLFGCPSIAELQASGGTLTRSHFCYMANHPTLLLPYVAIGGGLILVLIVMAVKK